MSNRVTEPEAQTAQKNQAEKNPQKRERTQPYLGIAAAFLFPSLGLLFPFVFVFVKISAHVPPLFRRSSP